MNKTLLRLLFPVVLSLLSLSLQAGRMVSLIDDGWCFRSPESAVAARVHLPHSWNSDAYSTKDYYRGSGVYSRSLTLPESCRGKRIYIRFDGIASYGEILIDGMVIGNSVGGYSSHTYDITPFVEVGKRHDLTVMADNSRKDIPPYSADFTFMGGLYRDAWLLALSDVHLDIANGPEEGFYVRAVPLDDGKWRLEVSGTLINHSSVKESIEVRMSLMDASGSCIASSSKKMTPCLRCATALGL